MDTMYTYSKIWYVWQGEWQYGKGYGKQNDRDSIDKIKYRALQLEKLIKNW